MKNYFNQNTLQSVNGARKIKLPKNAERIAKKIDDYRKSKNQ